MSHLHTIPEELKVCRAEGYPISEQALRSWLRRKIIPSIQVGNRRYVLHENVISFLRCESEVAR